jgi:hypothetical protein
MQVSTRRFLTPLAPANRLAVFNPHFMSEYAVPISLLSAAALLFITDNQLFNKFIIITMILTLPHDSAIRWEEVLSAL